MAIFENLSCYFPSLTVEQLKFNYSNVRGYAESFHKTKWLYDERNRIEQGKIAGRHAVRHRTSENFHH